MHHLWICTFHNIRLVAVTNEEALQFFAAYPVKDCGIGNLVSVQVKYGQHSTIMYRVKKLV
jgi:hypothetical protein